MLVDTSTIRKLIFRSHRVSCAVFGVEDADYTLLAAVRYGIVCMLIPFSLVMAYLIYTKPPFLPLGLLALNGANLTM